MKTFGFLCVLIISPLPALIYPNLDPENGLLMIDGANRIISNIEASKNDFKVAIINPKHHTQSNTFC